jgi:hypothetical protein
MQGTVIDMVPLGKMLMITGGIVFAIGAALVFYDRIPFLGKLPGDIAIRKDTFELYIPITTGIVVSVVLSVLMWLIMHLKGK